MTFRNLKANEIELRINTISEKGLTLLLYKDARCDMNILDETVGAENWQRDHKELKGNMYCGIAINKNRGDNSAPPLWVWKWDCGAESFSEKEKGEASDSFKRAGVNWGIGRELYTSPFIWIKAADCKITKNDKGKFVCFDKFYVSRIEIADKVITKLEIKIGQRVVFTMGYSMGQNVVQAKPIPPKAIEQAPRVVCPKCGKVMLAENWQGKRRTPAELMDKLGSCVECYLTKR